jgi:hypothetical protein
MKSGQATGCVTSIPLFLFAVIAVAYHIRLSWWVWIILVLFLWQTLTLAFYGRGDDGESFWEIRKHNAAIEREWKKNGRPIVGTAVGWRPDPFNKEDGYKDNGDGSYSRLIRGGTKEYRERFAKEVEKAKK